MSFFFFFSSRRRHTRWNCDWSSDVCSSDLDRARGLLRQRAADRATADAFAGLDDGLRELAGGARLALHQVQRQPFGGARADARQLVESGQQFANWFGQESHEKVAAARQPAYEAAQLEGLRRRG